MCGIVGLIGNFNEKYGQNIVDNMNNQIIHRGPDDYGIHIEKNIALGMRRLSIVDIQDGHQPMYDENDNFIIVFNGEIYNHTELREYLQKEGVLFNTRSDTEVILKSYIYYGDKFIEKLNGMFSFAIFDKSKNELVIYRDRLGVKPLYYYYNKEEQLFLFASEAKSIVKSGIFNNKKITNEELSNYLTLRYTSHEKSIWEGIYKLCHGNYLKFDLEKFDYKVNEYWKYDFNSAKYPEDTYINYLNEFKDILTNAIKIRMESSDVPVGVFLSGGLDSSVIASLAKKIGFNEFHTFSVGFENDRGENELNYAKEVSKYIGSIHHEIIISKDDFINFLPKYAMISDEPFGDMTSIPLYFLSQEASKFVKVVMSGEGADEILAGYSLDILQKNIKKLDLLRKFNLTKILRPFVSDNRKKQFDIMHAYSKENFLQKTQYYISKYWSDEEKNTLLKPEYKPNATTDTYIEKLYNYSSKDIIEQFSNSHSSTWLVEDLLTKGDRMTMAASIEARSPFLDYRLVEFSMKLPSRYKVNGNGNKLILRDFAKDLIPKSIIDRPKKGFSIPIYQWLQDELKDWAFDLIKTSDVLEKFLNKNIVLKEFDKLNTNLMSAHKIWVIIILHYWLEQWNNLGGKQQ